VRVLQYAGIVMVAATAGQLPAPVVLSPGQTRPGPKTINTAAIAAWLPKLATTGIAMPDVELIHQRLRQFNPAMMEITGNNERRRVFGPGLRGYLDFYGESDIPTVNAASEFLTLDYPEADKELIIRDFARTYWQQDAAMRHTDVAGNWFADGATTMGLAVPLVWGDVWLNGGAGLATLQAATGGSDEFAQVERLTAQDITWLTTPHNGTAWIVATQLKTVVAVAANEVTFEEAGPQRCSQFYNGYGLWKADNSKVFPITAEFTSAAGVTPPYGASKLRRRCTVPGHTFIVGDSVYCSAVAATRAATFIVNQAYWMIKGKMDTVYAEGRPQPAYAAQRNWGGSIAALHAAGILHPALVKSFEFLLLTDTPNFPGAGDQNYHGCTTYQFVSGTWETNGVEQSWAHDTTYWAAHKTAIAATVQSKMYDFA
jgi:hypothetical protein